MWRTGTLLHYWCSHYGKPTEVPQKIPYDPVIPILRIYPEKMKTLIQGAKIAIIHGVFFEPGYF